MNQKALEHLRRWRESPVAFVREVLGAEPDAWQLDALNAFPKSKRLALRASKGPGKSTVLAWLIWNFLATRRHPRVPCTSISGDNLSDCLWTELSKWQQRSEFLKAEFTWTATRIFNNAHPETWWASARTWPKKADAQAQAETLAGVHADNVLFVLDEAGGIPKAVAITADAALSSGKDTKLLVAGNPTHLSGPLYDACTSERNMWTVIEVSGDPDDPRRSPRVDLEWARGLIAKHGRNNDWVRVNVLNQFPAKEAGSLLGIEEVEASSKRTLPEAEWRYASKVLGIDVARFGDDRTVFFPRQGKAAHAPKVFRGLDTMEVAAQAANSIDVWKPDHIFVDQTGLGAGVVDRLRELGYPVLGIDSASKPIRPEPKFLNRRAEMWWSAAEWVKSGGCLPDDGELRAELIAPHYHFDSSARLVIESKADMKKRGLDSPDKADGFCLTFGLPVPTLSQSAFPGAYGQMGKALTEYDPIGRSEEGGRAATEYNPFEELRA